jgi:uncharacterized protein (DUF58 family)
MPRPTGRGYALLALAACTYAAARVVGTWELYLFAFAFLAAVIVSWLLVIATGRRVSVERGIAPERPLAGDEPDLSLLVKNDSFLPGPQLTLRNRVAGLADEDVEIEVASLAPRTHKALKTHFGRVNRGVYVLPATESVAEDPLGIARAFHRVSDPLPVTVYPRIAALESCVIYPDIGLRHDWSGRHGLLTPGASEFRGIRPHQPGEPLSHIDWKSTAKTGILMLREMEEPAGGEVTLLLDGTAEEVRGEAPDSNFELAVRAAGSVADFALRAGRSVNLLRHERTWRQTRLTADGAGRRGLLEALAQAQATASLPFINALRHLHADSSRLLPAQSVTLVMMSLTHQLVRALVTLREDGVRLSVLYVPGRLFERGMGGSPALLPFLPQRSGVHGRSDGAGPPDAFEIAGHSAGRADGPDAATGLTNEDRAHLLGLASAGIPSLTIDRHDDLVRALSLWQTPRRRGAAVL